MSSHKNRQQGKRKKRKPNKDKHRPKPKKQPNQRKGYKPREQRVPISPDAKSKIVALWCLIAMRKSRGYPFHFIQFMSDITILMEGLVHTKDVVDVWKAAVVKLPQTDRRKQFPGELTEEDVAQVLMIEGARDWGAVLISELLAELCCLKLSQFSLVGGMHFKTSKEMKRQHAVFDEIAEDLVDWLAKTRAE